MTTRYAKPQRPMILPHNRGIGNKQTHSGDDNSEGGGAEAMHALSRYRNLRLNRLESHNVGL